MLLSQRLAEALAPAIDFAFPARCPLCGAAIAQQSGLCSACWKGIAQNDLAAPSPCPLHSGAPGEQHGAECAEPGDQLSAPLLARAEADAVIGVTPYGDAARQLVLALKYGRRIGLATLMGRMIAARIGQQHGVVFVPVPLHRWRLWHRGFNQSALIAHATHRQRLRVGFAADVLCVDALIRRRRTPPLKGMNAAERARAVAGAIAFNSRRSSKIAGADILLIDDVLTSGATSTECAAALKQAGAKSVTIACFALAPRWCS